jgi:hypothetical protein
MRYPGASDVGKGLEVDVGDAVRKIHLLRQSSANGSWAEAQ